MVHQLHGKRIAALVAMGFEQSELLEPRMVLEAAGASVEIVSPEHTAVRGWYRGNWSREVDVDCTLVQAQAVDYDALLIPGGVISADALRINRDAVQLARIAFETGLPIAVICHGAWVLIEAGVVGGLRITSWPSLHSDLTNAGATWLDEPVVVDQGIVSSRRPADLPAFCEHMVEQFSQGRHVERLATFHRAV